MNSLLPTQIATSHFSSILAACAFLISSFEMHSRIVFEIQRRIRDRTVSLHIQVQFMRSIFLYLKEVATF